MQEIFDPSLQRSSPRPSFSTDLVPTDGEGEDLLDYELDWDEIFKMATNGWATPNSLGLDKCNIPDSQAQTQEDRQQSREQSSAKGELSKSGAGGRLIPFARSPFPGRIRDKSPVIGLSNKTVFRTCFRIGELLSENKRSTVIGDEVMFELYARITYSNRDHLAKTQTFQFVDLFKDQLPFLTGRLQNFRPGGLVERQSAAFWGAEGKMKPCRCVCTLKRDIKAETRWVALIVSIREATWAEIDQVRRIVSQE